MAVDQWASWQIFQQTSRTMDISWQRLTAEAGQVGCDQQSFGGSTLFMVCERWQQ
jgi:hypothetical protein